MALPGPLQFKVFRAYEHFEALSAEVQRYFKSEPAKLVGKHDPATNQPAVFLETVKPIPGRIAHIIGDMVQNLRSSLDYLVWELVIAAKNSPGKDNMFPICTTPGSFNRQLARGRLRGVAPAAAAVIQALQPYHLGEEAKTAALFMLDELCNINKHRHVPLINFGGGAVRGGVPTAVVDGVQYAILPPDLRALTSITVGPGEVEVKCDVIAAIAFGEGAAEEMEISKALRSLLLYIRDEFMPHFEQFF